MSQERGSCLRFTARALYVGSLIAIFSSVAMGSRLPPPVPKASCASDDRVESVQGQTTVSERFGSQPEQAYNCNLELVGQFEGEGADADLEVFGDCAYFSIFPTPKTKNPGVAVLDVSNSRFPKATTYLASPGMLFPHKSLEISHARKLLVANNGSLTPPVLDIYEISSCRHPVLKGSVKLPDSISSHSGQFSPDGLTFYGVMYDERNPVLFALDVSDPSNARSIATWVPPKDKAGWVTHGVVISKDAHLAYVSIKRMTDDWEKSINPNGLSIFDITDVEARGAKAQFQLLGNLFWEDAHGASGMLALKINGRRYLAFSDTLGTTGYKKPIREDACSSGKPGHGFTRIIDIQDEKHPTIVSKLLFEVSLPTNCSRSLHDPTLFASYGSFACGVDDDEDAKLLACGHAEAGLRVFDIRDPEQPREVAYYKPPARRTQERPGSILRHIYSPPNDITADSVLASPKFRNKGQEIWFTSIDNGFQVVRFSERFLASHEDLFQR